MAAEQPLIFGGLITDTCIITPGTAGVLIASADGSEVSTETGSAALAAVLTTSTAYELSVEAPTQFEAPTPDSANENVSFEASMSSSGVTELVEIVGGVTAELGMGLTDVEVDITATKSSGGFEAGTYAATATLVCVASGG